MFLSKQISPLAMMALGLFQGANAFGEFTVNCQPLTIQRGDPIVQPGAISSHVHAVTGGTAFALTQTNAQARAAGATTCDKTLDRSNYWQPQVYHQRTDGKFEMVTFQGNAAYYLSRACDYAPGRTDCNSAPHPIAPPAGLRMVVGNPARRTFNASNIEDTAISVVCLGGIDEGQRPELPRLPCTRIRAETFFPSCWDGQNLDSSDHKSHMAFPAIGDFQGGVCPQSHPTAILSVFYEFFYDTGAIQNPNRLVLACGDATGYGLHADYLQGWTDQNALENAMETCTDNGATVNSPGCSLAVLPGPSSGSSSSQVPVVAAPNDNVGLDGSPLAALPGNNPITTA